MEPKFARRLLSLFCCELSMRVLLAPSGAAAFERHGLWPHRRLSGAAQRALRPHSGRTAVLPNPASLAGNDDSAARYTPIERTRASSSCAIILFKRLSSQFQDGTGLGRDNLKVRASPRRVFPRDHLFPRFALLLLLCIVLLFNLFICSAALPLLCFKFCALL